MRTPEPVVLSGYGVTLEPLSEPHYADLLVAAADPAVWTWIAVPQPRRVEDLAAFQRLDGIPFAVVVAGRSVGSTSYLDVDVPVEGLEIGATWYQRQLWRTHVNPACKLLLLEHAFEVLGAQRVTLKTDALNTRSRSAIARLGCVYEGTLRHNRLRVDGSVRDTAYYSLLASEWPSAKAGLLDRTGTSAT